MNLQRCVKGHFYDADLNASCPHCEQMGADQETVALSAVVEEDSVTTPINEEKTVSTKSTLAAEIGTIQNSSASTKPGEDDSVTVSFSSAKYGTEPVVGWLVCTEGPHFGEDFRLKAGKNFVGRSSSMDAALTKDSSVSRDRHAIVLYDPKTHLFLVQPGESRELCYLNDQVVLSAQELKLNDVISVGDSKLMFFPCCNTVFNWEMAKKNEE